MATTRLKTLVQNNIISEHEAQRVALRISQKDSLVINAFELQDDVLLGWALQGALQFSAVPAIQPRTPYYALSIPSPSSIDYSEYKRMQAFNVNHTLAAGKTPELLNFRPTYAQPPPLRLMHPIFGSFLDIFYGQAHEVGTHPVRRDYAFLQDLSVTMCNVYPNEAARQVAVRQKLKMYLHRGLYTMFDSQEDVKLELYPGCGNTIPDGAIVNKNPGADWMTEVDEIKNEFQKSISDPYVQAATYYRLFWVHRHDSFNHLNSCCPALMLEIVGACLRVSALAFGDRVLCQPLTPYLHIMDLRRHDPLHMEAVARALVAVRITIDNLNDYAEQLAKASHKTEEQVMLQHELLAGQVWAGQPSMLGTAPRERVVEGLPWRLQNPALQTQQLMEGKQLYVVQHAAKPRRVFKYTHQYNKELHELLASQTPPLAPILHACVRLPGGLYEVQMELLAQEDGWRMLQDCMQLEEARAAAMRALEVLHNLQVDIAGKTHRMVLGDARASNVMVRSVAGHVDVRFVDLDWAGWEGHARYPPFISPLIDWPMGAGDGMFITQQHDRELLSKVVEERHAPYSWATE